MENKQAHPLAKRIAILFALILFYLTLWPVPIEPKAWQAPQNHGYSGDFTQNSHLLPLTFIPIEGDSGPEDLAINSNGQVYVSLHSGSIAKINTDTQQVEPWINTGGRPLGIEFDQAGNLIVADAYLGLLSITADGHIKVLTDAVDGTAILYADDLDIADNGLIYFSDASTRFGAKDNGGTLAASLLDILEHSANGRMLVFDPVANTTKVIADNLDFPNGVAISHDQKSVLFNETGTYRVLRFWIDGDKAGEIDVMIENLPGFPDNLSRGKNNTYWLGLTSPRSDVVDALSDKPFLRKVVQRLPEFARPKAQNYGHIVAIDESGKVLHSLQDPSGRYGLTTGAVESKDWLYVSSLTEDEIGIRAIPSS